MAVIVKINDSWIDLLSFDEVESAENCDAPASGGCGHCACGISGRSFRAGIPSDLAIKVGDRVEVSASTARAFGSFLAVIGIPALVGILSWKLIGSVYSAINEPARALVTSFGVALGAGITVLAAGKKSVLPEITRILE